MVFGQILALAISVADLLTERIFTKTTQIKAKVISFAAGVSVSYVFLILLPEIYNGAVLIDKLLFLPILFGFSTFHLIEKHIRQRYSRGKFKREHQAMHTLSSFLYLLVAGFVIAEITENRLLGGFLLFIPILFHVIIDSVPKTDTSKYFPKAFLSSSALLGSVVAIFINLGLVYDLILLGIVGGALLYTIIRESLPKEREGRPFYFVIGVLLFSVLVLLLWSLGL